MEKSFLSGPEPNHEDQLTEAQKIDSMRPGSMSQSRSIYDLAEDDETPAIEQAKLRQRQDNKETFRVHNKPDFKIGPELAARVKKQRELDEIARDKKYAEKQKNAEKQREAQNLADRSLAKDESGAIIPIDPDTQPRAYRHSLSTEPLYPEPKSLYDAKADEEFKKRRSDAKKELPDRVSVVAEIDIELESRMKTSIIYQIILVVALIFLAINTLWKNMHIVNIMLELLCAATLIAASIPLVRKDKNRQLVPVQSQQRTAFTAVTIIPSLVLKLAIGAIVTAPVSSLSGIITLVFFAVGFSIGASIHFDFLKKCHVYQLAIVKDLDLLFFLSLQFITQVLPALLTGNLLNIASSAIYALVISLVLYLFETFFWKIAK